VELVMAVAHGDARALEELYVRYSHSVFSMAYSLLRDYAAAEEVAQEILWPCGRGRAGSIRSMGSSGIGSCTWPTTA